MEFDRAIAELDTLVETLEREGDERALMLLQLVDAIHRPGLERIVAGDMEHPHAFALLAMYDLADVDERTQVEDALDEVRPYIHSHGGDLELLDVEDGVVHVRMSGSCHGCAASAITLKRGIEEALRQSFPGFKEVVAHEPEGDEKENGSTGPQLLQIEGLNKPDVEGLKRPVFVDAGELADLPPGELKAVRVDDISVVLANVEGEVYAFKNACPVDGMPLEGGRLTGTVLVCPYHNCAYDARSGKRVDEPSEARLAVIPIAVRDGVLQVAVNVL